MNRNDTKLHRNQFTQLRIVYIVCIHNIIVNQHMSYSLNIALPYRVEVKDLNVTEIYPSFDV